MTKIKKRMNISSNQTICSIFEEQVFNNPFDNICYSNGKFFSYQEINLKANILAKHLLEIKNDKK